MSESDLDYSDKITGFQTFRYRTTYDDTTLFNIQENFNYEKFSRFSEGGFETIWVELRLHAKSKAIFFCFAYRPPAKGKDLALVKSMFNHNSTSINKLPGKFEIFILGDFNCNMLCSNNLISVVKDTTSVKPSC